MIVDHIGTLTPTFRNFPVEQAFSLEVADLDNDGFLDLIYGGHEAGFPTNIAWGQNWSNCKNNARNCNPLSSETLCFSQDQQIILQSCVCNAAR